MKWSHLLPMNILALGDSLAERAEKLRQERFELWPTQDQIFRALTLTPPDKTKVVIVGQDPYHTPGQADGLAFSIKNGNPIQPSLQNIFTELASDLNIPMPSTTDLTPWAEQGVLLLNSILTVHTGQANSCQDWGWEHFTGAIVQVAATQLQQPVVLIGWGKNAQQIVEKTKVQNRPDRLILTSSHPSPFSASRSTRTSVAFFGSRPFSKTNEFLKSHGVDPINWTLP